MIGGMLEEFNRRRNGSRSPEFAAALEECARWGVVVRVGVPRARLPKLKYQAPQNTAGILRGVIVWHDWDSSIDACGLLHEMNHVIVARVTKRSPTHHDEQRMLALECEAAERLGFLDTWQMWTDDFGLIRKVRSTGNDWAHVPMGTFGEVSAEVRQEVLGTSIEWCRARGLFEPVEVRPTYRIRGAS